MVVSQSQFVEDLGLSFRPEQNISIPSSVVRKLVPSLARALIVALIQPLLCFFRRPASPPYTGSVAELLVSSRRFASAYLSLLDRMGTNFWWLDDEPKWVARILCN